MLKARENRTTPRFPCLAAIRTGTKHGFTLIELLVVIAIIALLVSLLMPSLKQAKDLAKQSLCLSNMRMVAMAVPMYADEYDGWMPRYAEVDRPPFDRHGIDISWYDGWDGPVMGVFRFALIRTMQTDWADPLYDGDGFLAPYISGGKRREHIIGCPSLPKDPTPAVAYTLGRSRNTRIERAKGYGINWQEGVCILDEENNPSIHLRLNKVHRPSELVFMCDGLGGGGEIRNSYAYPHGEGLWDHNTAFIPRDRHFGTFSMAFVGGHADSGTMYDRFTNHYFKNTMPQ